MDIIMFLLNMIKDWTIYTGHEMISNPERTMYCIFIGIVIGIVSLVWDWFKNIMSIK